MKMLVLTRARDEKVVVTVPPSDRPTRLLVEPVDIRASRVRLGFTAPNEVVIDRAEVYREKTRTSVAASC